MQSIKQEVNKAQMIHESVQPVYKMDLSKDLKGHNCYTPQTKPMSKISSHIVYQFSHLELTKENPQKQEIHESRTTIK